MPPKVLQKNPNRNGGGGDGAGVLPIPASVRAPPAPKPPAARLKLEIRRLPPGLTLSEFEETLGDEWKLGKGRVDWREYRQGKSKNVSKMPELSRCYVHVVKEEWVGEFEKRFFAVVFRDKAGTWKSVAAAGGGAPMVGFAMNQRVPLQQGKQRARADNRQGTIDQDAEYMAFLEAETQPIPKASAIDSANAEKKEEEAGGKGKVKSTPLIEDLRERKANKAKAAASKAEKADRKGKGDSKGEESSSAATSGGKKGDKGKVEQAAKEVAKAANKQAAGKQGQNNNNAATNANANNASQKTAQTPAKGRRGAAQQNAKATAAAATAAQPQTQPQTTPAGPAAQRGSAQRQRGNNAEGIKKMLQKDLGIKPKAAAADSPAQTGNAAAARNTSNNQQTPAQPKTPAQTPKQQQQQQQSSNNSGPPKAYLKHANPSQGMTEILIQQALAQFGEMNNVTIDPRKGTAIAVFKTQEGLKKAVQAKKVPVAKGAVEVIEFKDRGGGGGGGSGSGGGGGGGNNNNNNGNNNNNSGNGGNNNSGGGGGGGGGGGRGGFRNRGGRAGRGGNNNSGTANANAGKAGGGGGGGGQAAAAAG